MWKFDNTLSVDARFECIEGVEGTYKVKNFGIEKK